MGIICRSIIHSYVNGKRIIKCICKHPPCPEHAAHKIALNTKLREKYRHDPDFRKRNNDATRRWLEKSRAHKGGSRSITPDKKLSQQIQSSATQEKSQQRKISEESLEKKRQESRDRAQMNYARHQFNPYLQTKTMSLQKGNKSCWKKRRTIERFLEYFTDGNLELAIEEAKRLTDLRTPSLSPERMSYENM